MTRSLKLRLSTGALGGVLLFTGLAVAIPVRDTSLKTQTDIPEWMLAKRPSMEQPARGVDGIFELTAERARERDLEYTGSNSLRNRLALYDRTGSPYQRVQARRQIEKMMRYQRAQRQRILAQSAGQVPPPQTGTPEGRWRSLGPDNLGGRTHGFVIDPTNPDVMYAGGIAGGVWKSTDAGGSWRPLNDTFSNLAVSSLALDPNNSQTIYAGTGDTVDQNYRTGSRGSGILRSTDGGANWQILSSTQNQDFLFVNQLMFSPNDPNVLYAGTYTGMWRSTDAGGTWTKLFGHDSRFGCTDFDVRRGGSSDTIVASCGGLSDPGGIFVSNDGGGNWTNVVNGINGIVIGRSDVAFGVSDPDVVYASVSDPYGGGVAVIRSNSAGADGSWSIVNDVSGKPGSPPIFGWCDQPQTPGGQGYYDNVIMVDPTNAERIWVGGVDVFRSDDGGQNLYPISYWWLDYANNFNQDYQGLPFTHADQHAMAFHPGYNGGSNTTMYFANDGGLWVTDNATAQADNPDCQRATSKVAFRSLNNGYVTSLFREGAIAGERFAIVGGLQDNGTWLDSELTGPPNPWATIAGGDGGYVAIDPTGSSVVVTYPNGGMEKVSGGSVVPANVGIDEPGGFVPPLVGDPNDGNVLWAGMISMWRSVDQAATWQRVSGPLSGETVETIAVANGAPDLVLASTADGGLYRTAEGRKELPAWTNVVPPGGVQGPITSIGFDPNDPNIAFFTVGRFGVGKVYRSTDAGVTWNNVDGSGPTGIPDSPAYAVAVNPEDSRMVYLGTDSGVFESLDGGTTWAIANDNLATTTVEDLIFRPGTSELYAFTYGRGVYMVNVRG